MPRTTRHPVLAILLLSGLVGCQRTDVTLRLDSLVAVASIGQAEGSDTVMLGTINALARTPEGTILALDGDGPMVRVFDDQLRPIGLWSRKGAGPGELANPDGGLAVLGDGRIVVRDPGNARLLVLDARGRPAATWAVADPGLRTRDNFGRSGDTLLSRVVIDARGPIEGWRYGLARIAPDGTVRDTVPFPVDPKPVPTLVARRGGNTAELPVPWAPRTHVAWHPGGEFAVARGDAYRVTWRGPAGPVRVEREVVGAPITDEERVAARDTAIAGMRWLDPTWQWSGPDIPTAKPVIGGLIVADDGRVGVLREGPGLEAGWTLELYRADGTALWSVALPRALRQRPAPLLLTDGVIGLTVEDDGIPRLVRYRVEPR